MNASPASLDYLFSRCLQPNVTFEERQQFLLLAGLPENQQRLESLIAALYPSSMRAPGPDEATSESILQAIFASQISTHTRTSYRSTTDSAPAAASPVHPVHFLRTAWFRSAAAAILILIISAVAYLWKTQKPAPALVQGNPAPVQNDVVAPQRPHATITLADGQKIIVDTAREGILTNQVTKLGDGQLQYSKAAYEKIEWHTLTVPRGSLVVELTLADGTRVWMNAASTLRYPTGFVDSERKVELTGEAYFEVAKDPKKKFIVSGGGITTEVLGTHFNVNTYPDEESMKVTLLEGSVNVIGGVSNLVIKPGAQAEFTRGVLRVNQSVDVDRVMAWKNGYFSFQQADFGTVLRQISRWYDIEVAFEGKMPDRKFGGAISRKANLSEVLKIFEEMKIYFKIEGKKIIAQPYHYIK